MQWEKFMGFKLFQVDKGCCSNSRCIGGLSAPMNKEQRKEAKNTVIGEFSNIKHWRGILSMIKLGNSPSGLRFHFLQLDDFDGGNDICKIVFPWMISNYFQEHKFLGFCNEVLRSVPLTFLREAPVVKQIVGEWSNQLQLARFPSNEVSFHSNILFSLFFEHLIGHVKMVSSYRFM
ncbi:uncharacterized protein [Euphorbia lathyris]|uniref:uncharacterized protein isoform X2 n=1 Tax=Euphorbia lathyris TaxID=212925 RepID=UPI0033135049